MPRPEDDPIEVILVDRRRRPVLTGVVVHRPRDLGDLRPIRRRRIPTTNILRTLCDLGAVDPDGLSGALGHVASLKLASLGAIQSAIVRHSRRGRAGVPALRQALEEWTIRGKVPDSVLEPAMRKLLDDYGIGPWQFHAVICDYEVDFWLVDTAVVVECDGWDFHARTREQMERDAERDSVLIGAGYLPVHFTYRQIMKNPAKVAARISGALGHWAGGIRVS